MSTSLCSNETPHSNPGLAANFQANLTNPVPLAAAMQLIEDEYPIRFVLRDYGIVVVDASRIPAGAMLVSDFIKRGPQDGKSPSK